MAIDGTLARTRRGKWSSGLGGFIGICRQSTSLCGWFPVEIPVDGAPPPPLTFILLYTAFQ
jgi:hypothetical protein